MDIFTKLADKDLYSNGLVVLVFEPKLVSISGCLFLGSIFLLQFNSFGMAIFLSIKIVNSTICKGCDIKWFFSYR